MRPIYMMLLCAMLLLPLAGCGSAGQVSLTDEEADILEQIGDDVHVVTDDSYPQLVTQMQQDADAFSGQVYQLEGVYTTTTVNGVESPYVYRVVSCDGQTTWCGLPLKYLTKDLPDGAWVRVSGIVNSGQFQDESATVLEVFAVETLQQAGQTELTWDGAL